VTNERRNGLHLKWVSRRATQRLCKICAYQFVGGTFPSTEMIRRACPSKWSETLCPGRNDDLHGTFTDDTSWVTSRVNNPPPPAGEIGIFRGNHQTGFQLLLSLQMGVKASLFLDVLEMPSAGLYQRSCWTGMFQGFLARTSVARLSVPRKYYFRKCLPR
jgi:hypothetical protein